MARATWVLAATTAIGFVMSSYLACHRSRSCAAPESAAPPTTSTSQAMPAPSLPRAPCVDLEKMTARTPAAADDSSAQSALDTRARITELMAALLGRQSGESDDEYRTRLAATLQALLHEPRARVSEMRRTAEAKAGVTAEQSAMLDAAFTKVYADMLALTNNAIADGKLSPYERNAPGWLQFAGEVGHELDGANGAIAKVLRPEQIRAMYDAGFDWSEYLGTQTPWENFAVLPRAPSK
jgi:hypothetical protein